MTRKPLLIVPLCLVVAGAAWLRFAHADDTATAASVDDPGISDQINGLSS